MKKLVLFTALIALVTSCKRVYEDESVYLVLRNDNHEVILTEEAEVTESRRAFMLLKTGSNGQLNYLKREDGKYEGELEIYRWDEGFFELNINLERKAIGQTLMKGTFSGIQRELVNGQITGNDITVKGSIELRD